MSPLAKQLWVMDAKDFVQFLYNSVYNSNYHYRTLRITMVVGLDFLVEVRIHKAISIHEKIRNLQNINS